MRRKYLGQHIIFDSTFVVSLSFNGYGASTVFVSFISRKREKRLVSVYIYIFNTKAIVNSGNVFGYLNAKYQCLEMFQTPETV